MSEHGSEFLALQRALVGRYSLVRELGRGGMGIVFLARDVALDRQVAIKLLPPSLAADARHRAQFLREARLAAGLAHPNIVPIHGVEEQGELVWFVMGYVAGESLGARVRRTGPLPAGEVVPIVRQVAMALAHAHARGVVHRDVKPDNILLERDSGRALVTDFGIAGLAQDAGLSGATRAGTPLYLSPEQASGAAGDARADVYALGVTAWFALTGRHPHEGATVPALLVAKVSAAPPSIASAVPGLPARLSAAIDRSLAQAPEDRWSDLEELARELGALGGTADTPPVIRAFVRSAITLGDDAALGSMVAASSLGVMQFLITDGSLIDGLVGQAVMLPIAGVAVSFGLIRLAQSATAAVDVVRQGYDHADVARAVAREVRDRDLEARPSAQRRRDALYYGSLGAAKSAVAIWIVASDLPGWLWLPAAIVAALVPALTILKVDRILRPGSGRWARWLQGPVGRGLFSLIGSVTGRRRRHTLPGTPTVAALGGEVSELFGALPHDARGAMADLPRLVDGLQREAAALRARPRSEDTDARLGTIAVALETLRVELLSLQAGLRTVPDVTAALDRARQLGERVDERLEPMAEITPA